MAGRMTIGIALTGMLLGLASPASAWAVDFTIRIPMKLTNLHPGIFQGSVFCAVRVTEPGVIGASIGQAAQNFAISRGEFGGTVVLQITVRPGTDPRQARSYDCQLSLAARDSRGSYTIDGRNYRTVAGGAFLPYRGTTPVFRVIGPLTSR